MSNLYATANKVNVNQRNMKLKYILNAVTILFSALTRMFPKPTFAP